MTSRSAVSRRGAADSAVCPAYPRGLAACSAHPSGMGNPLTRGSMHVFVTDQRPDCGTFYGCVLTKVLSSGGR